MISQRTAQAVFLLIPLLLLSACSSTDRFRTPKNPDPVIQGEVTEEKARKALHMKVARKMEFLQENSDRFKDQVVAIPMNATTYYFKYYDEFPEGFEGISVTASPTGTFAPSYTAEAKFRKVRYQTRYSKSKRKAAADDDYVRDEGVQKNAYNFDGNTWRLRNSIFEVTKTSVFREDQWVATHGRIRRVEEEKPEYFVDKLQTLFGLLD